MVHSPKYATMHSDPIHDDQLQFDLPVENELLMMKLQAEFGAECMTGQEEIPPVVVHEFLKSVYEFEQRFREPVHRISVYEKIGRPPFVPADSLSAGQCRDELQRLLAIMRGHQLQLDVLGDYDDALIYRFVTEEFFGCEIEAFELPGFMHHFCYEEFHPNHAMDIRNRAAEFITQWFGRGINEYSWQLGNEFVLPDTRTFRKDELLKKIARCFEAYTSFANGVFQIRNQQFQWDERRECGDGWVEAWVKYAATGIDGRCVSFEGMAKFYLSNVNGWWSIYYFDMPGFSWHGG